MTYVLWIVQGLLALLFMFAGGMKLILPLEKMAGPVELPGWLLRFIGVWEVLGAVGLILPAVLRIRPGLTPLAACGLVIIMIGATVITLDAGLIGPAVMSLVVGLLTASSRSAGGDSPHSADRRETPFSRRREGPEWSTAADRDSSRRSAGVTMCSSMRSAGRRSVAIDD